VEQDILIHGARQLVTLRGDRQVRRGSAMKDLAVIKDGAVLIRNSTIVAVGTSRQLENMREARGAVKIPVNGRVVMPGFTDCSMRLMLGGMEAAVRRASGSILVHEPNAVLRTALQHGTTRAELKIGGKDAADELRALRQCLRLDPRGNDLVRTWEVCTGSNDDSAEIVRSRAIVFDYLQRPNAASFLEVELGPESLNPAKALFEAALDRGLARKIRWRGPVDRSLIDLASQVSARTISGISSLSQSLAEKLCPLPIVLAVSVNHEMSTSFRGVLEIRSFLDGGGAVALASGYDPLESPSFSMQMAIALAVFCLKLTPEEAISAATINAAYAIGVGGKAGSIELGKEADLLVMNMGDYRDLPRQFGSNNAGMVIRGGTVVLNRIGWKGPK
jgi:imidazolonepropionase